MENITYTQCGDYLLPDITLTEPPDAPPLGHYGMMHKDYLRREKPTLYAVLLLTERLYPLCREIDDTAQERMSQTALGNRQAMEEIIFAELIYC